MKDRVFELTDLLMGIEGSSEEPGFEQKMRDLRMRWERADTDFHAAFYLLKQLGPDDAMTVYPGTSGLEKAFAELEDCCREWQAVLAGIAPEN